jgi:hypothetical protein
VVQEFAEGGAVCLAEAGAPDQGEHRGCLDVVDDQAFSWVSWLAAMDSERMAMPSPRLARSATAPGALACSAMSGWMPWAAQAWSSTVRIPVPAGRHTIGYAVMSARVTRALPGQGVAGRQGRDEPFADDRQRAQPRGRGAGRSDEGQVRLAGADAFGEPVGVVLDQGDLDAGVGAVETRRGH